MTANILIIAALVVLFIGGYRHDITHFKRQLKRRNLRLEKYEQIPGKKFKSSFKIK